MRIFIFIICIALMGSCSNPEQKITSAVVVEPGSVNNHVSQKWLAALQTRQSKPYLDSLADVSRGLTGAEQDWLKLMQSRAPYWNALRDSLNVPFNTVTLPDSIVVLAGYLGEDDGFTYQDRTVCFDLTAFQTNYGAATSTENINRIDRIFAHEYTHLLHKSWAQANTLQLKNFKDSILWECLYEGIGTYRSLSKKWMLENGSLPVATIEALEKLYPVFTERIILAHSIKNPTAAEKAVINKNLSRGNVDKKWGAFPMAVWLMLEAKGDDQKLAVWIKGGPDSVLKLADKYLPETHRQELRQALTP